MRALCDAIVVGAETVARDDPRLTTRLVEGNNPVRVVLDPRRRLPPDHRVFTDGEARTLVVHASAGGDAVTRGWGGAEAVSVPARGKGDGLALAAVLAELHGRALRRVFVEGGGVTVSAFLEAGLLDRLQVAIAPVIIGDGRRGIRLPPRESMGDCLRPSVRVFRMGSDILFDCEPTRGEERPPDEIAGPALLRVI
jgi:riboflavin-specific deaminase-like protein